MGKKFLCTMLAAVLLLTSGTGAMAAGESASDSFASQAAVYLDGTQLSQTAYVQDGAAYLPVRAICTALGYDVQWSGEQRTVTASGSTGTAVLDLKGMTLTTKYGATGYITGSFLLLDSRVYLESGLFADAFGVSVCYNEAGNEVDVSRIQENPVSITTMKFSSDGEYLNVTLQYPQVGGLEDPDAQDAVNAALRGAAADAVEEGLRNAYDLSGVRAEYPDYTGRCETYFSCRITYNQNGLLCVVADDYQYSGGAHGLTVQTSYLFDLATGKRLQLSDLMADDSYGSLIDSSVRAMIDERIASDELAEIEGSSFVTVGDSPDFYLSDDAVVIYFQEYEHFPYAAGIQEFSIAYAVLKDHLKSDYRFFWTDPAGNAAVGQ